MWREYGAEWFADAIVDTGGIAVGLIACLVLVYVAIRNARSAVPVSLALYGLGLIAMLFCSALYNLYVDDPQRGIFRQLDHAAIFLMIAGTYSPLALLSIRGATGVRTFAFVWLAASLGVLLKFLVPHQFEQLSIAAYLVLGWAILAVRRPLRAAIPQPGFTLLAIGCGLYSAGVVFFLWNGLHYQLAIWHGFVLAGAACHFACIVGYVAGPTALKALAAPS